MAEFKYVIPRKGLIVRYPGTKAILPEEGMTVPWIGPDGRYFRRCVRTGDCQIGKPPKKEKIKKVENIKVDKEK